MQQLTSFDDVVAALGGTSATARLIGRRPSNIAQWRARHGAFPAAEFLNICAALEAAGHPPPSRDLFRFAEVPARAKAERRTQRRGRRA